MDKNKIKYYQIKKIINENKDRFFLNSTLIVILFFSYLGHLETINFDLYFGDLHAIFRDFFSGKIKTNITHPLWGYGFLIYLLNLNCILII